MILATKTIACLILVSCQLVLTVKGRNVENPTTTVSHGASGPTVIEGDAESHTVGKPRQTRDKEVNVKYFALKKGKRIKVLGTFLNLHQ